MGDFDGFEWHITDFDGFPWISMVRSVAMAVGKSVQIQTRPQPFPRQDVHLDPDRAILNWLDISVIQSDPVV